MARAMGSEGGEEETCVHIQDSPTPVATTDMMTAQARESESVGRGPPGRLTTIGCDEHLGTGRSDADDEAVRNVSDHGHTSSEAFGGAPEIHSKLLQARDGVNIDNASKLVHNNAELQAVADATKAVGQDSFEVKTKDAVPKSVEDTPAVVGGESQHASGLFGDPGRGAVFAPIKPPFLGTQLPARTAAPSAGAASKSDIAGGENDRCDEQITETEKASDEGVLTASGHPVEQDRGDVERQNEDVRNAGQAFALRDMSTGVETEEAGFGTGGFASIVDDGDHFDTDKLFADDGPPPEDKDMEDQSKSDQS